MTRSHTDNDRRSQEMNPQHGVSHRCRHADPLRAVRVCIANAGTIRVNHYRAHNAHRPAGRHFLADLRAAQRRGWVEDVGGQNRGIRHYTVTKQGRQAAREAAGKEDGNG